MGWPQAASKSTRLRETPGFLFLFVVIDNLYRRVTTHQSTVAQVFIDLWPRPIQAGLRNTLAYLSDYQRFSFPVLKEFPRVARIDPPPVFCKDTGCVANDGLILLYRDEIHLSKAGSNFLGRGLALPSFSQSFAFFTSP